MGQLTPRRRALVVDDEVPIRELLRLHLGLAGFEVDDLGDGRDALSRTHARPFDLLVLDVMLPGLDGVSLCRAVRAEGPNRHAPILMLTARDAESDKVIGLESGADDYLTKPFGVRELVARVGAITRRYERVESLLGTAASQIVSRHLTLDVPRREASVRGIPVDLTKQEFEVLRQLASHPGIVLSRQALLRGAWPDDTYVTERTVDTVVSRLRHKLERDPQDPELIVTAWGVGYKFLDAV